MKKLITVTAHEASGITGSDANATWDDSAVNWDDASVAWDGGPVYEASPTKPIFSIDKEQIPNAY